MYIHYNRQTIKRFFDTYPVGDKYRNEKDSEQKTKNSIFKEEGPNLFISEDDMFFEEILRNKLLEEAKLKFSIMSLTHLDNLKVPFPEDNENLDYKKYYKIKKKTYKKPNSQSGILL